MRSLVNSCHQSDVERQHDIPALEIRLRIEIQRIGNRPPATVLAANVPDVVNVGSDTLDGDLFQVDHQVVAHLVLEVGENCVALVTCRPHRSSS